MIEDEASLSSQLAELQRGLPEAPKKAKTPPRQPRRDNLPEHLERIVWMLACPSHSDTFRMSLVASVMSLVQSAKLNGLDPWAYLRDVLARIHSLPSQRLDELLPHRCRPREPRKPSGHVPGRASKWRRRTLTKKVGTATV